MKILLIGPPGSGKGTISELLIKNDQFMHVSTGNLFRAILKENSTLAEEIKDLMQKGELIPDHITNKVAANAIQKLIDNNQDFILDGYPRTLNQADYLSNYCPLDYVFYLDINHDQLMKRLVGRLTCSDCNVVYNIYFKPPQTANLCDYCNQTLTKRSDDNEVSVQNRLAEYEKLTLPLVKYYKEKKKLITIDVDCKVEEAYAKIKQQLLK